MIADVITAVIVLVFLLGGWKKGLIRAVLDFAYMAVALGLSVFFYPAASAWLMGTSAAARVQQAIQGHLEQRGAEAVSGMLPEFLRGTAGPAVNAGAAGLTAQVMSVLAFVVLFAALCVALRLAASVLNVVAKLPLLRTANKLGGLVIGGVNGLLLVYVLLAAAAVLELAQGASWFDGSVLAAQLYHNNIILKILF